MSARIRTVFRDCGKATTGRSCDSDNKGLPMNFNSRAAMIVIVVVALVVIAVAVAAARIWQHSADPQAEPVRTTGSAPGGR